VPNEAKPRRACDGGFYGKFGLGDIVNGMISSTAMDGAADSSVGRNCPV